MGEENDILRNGMARDGQRRLNCYRSLDKAAREAIVEDWLSQQADSEATSWESAVERFFPDHAAAWSDPDEHYRRLTSDWNTLDALQYVDWPALMGAGNQRVLDLGAGTGWLSAYLSRFDEVASIDTLDSSRRLLEKMLPSIVERMEGVAEKINPIRALFTPLQRPASSYDLIVASSAVHHAPQLSGVLDECARVLAASGVLVILNETPLSTYRSLNWMARIGIKAALSLLAGRCPTYARTVSGGGILYEPYLGDRAYSLRQWKTAFAQSNWRVSVIRTPLGSYKGGGRRQTRLTHFVLRKSAAATA